MLKDGKFRVISSDRVPVDFSELKFDFTLGADIKRTALKTVFATAAMFFPKEVDGFTVPRTELKNALSDAAPKCVEIDLHDHNALDHQRDELWHLVYVEQSGTIMQQRRCDGRMISDRLRRVSLPTSSLFPGDPTTDISETQRVKFMIKGGEIFRNDSLRARSAPRRYPGRFAKVRVGTWRGRVPAPFESADLTL